MGIYISIYSYLFLSLSLSPLSPLSLSLILIQQTPRCFVRFTLMFFCFILD